MEDGEIGLGWMVFMAGKEEMLMVWFEDELDF